MAGNGKLKKQTNTFFSSSLKDRKQNFMTLTFSQKNKINKFIEIG